MNPQRGDVPVTIAGTVYTMRPSFEALAAIEEKTGVGIIPLWRRFGQQDFGIRDVVTVVTEAVRAGEGKVPDKFPALIVQTGIFTLAQPIASFLTNALAGDKAEGNEEAAAQ
jgi:hypothetical protein